jgi:hypothetical protein
MNPLKSFETTLTSLVEGVFGRLFRSEVRPMELARKLAREMDAHRTVSVSRVYAPNEYAVWLSPRDRARYEGVEDELIDELCAYLLEHARAEGLTLASPPALAFHTDSALALGELGIQARLVRPDGREGEPVEQVPPGRGGADYRAAGPGGRGAEAPDGRGRERLGDRGGGGSAVGGGAGSAVGGGAGSAVGGGAGLAVGGSARPRPGEGRGETLIFGDARGLREPAAREVRPSRAMLLLDGRRLLIAPGGAILGRSRECDIVLDDAGVSRRHAHIRPAEDGWTIEDLRSTNGVLLNGQPLHSVHPLYPGDRIELGSTEVAFELR